MVVLADGDEHLGGSVKGRRFIEGIGLRYYLREGSYRKQPP